jgi:hypothetical protein
VTCASASLAALNRHRDSGRGPGSHHDGLAGASLSEASAAGREVAGSSSFPQGRAARAPRSAPVGRDTGAASSHWRLPANDVVAAVLQDRWRSKVIRRRYHDGRGEHISSLVGPERWHQQTGNYLADLGTL